MTNFIRKPVNLSKLQTGAISDGSSFTSSVPYEQYTSAWVEVLLPGTLLNPAAAIDPTNISTGEANLVNDVLTDLTYNNSSAGTVNKELPAVDAGSSVTLSQVDLYWWTNVTYTASNYSIQGSNDGTTFTDIVTGLDSTGISGLVQIPVPTGTPAYRYYRVFCVQGNNASWCVISEIDLRLNDGGTKTIHAEEIEGVTICQSAGGFLEIQNDSGQSLDFEIIYMSDTAIVGSLDSPFFKAAGAVSANGVAQTISGATVSQVSTGIYQVTFNSPAPSAVYPVIISPEGLAARDDYFLDYWSRTVNGFQVRGTEQDNGGTAGVYINMPFSFFVPNI